MPSPYLDPVLSHVIYISVFAAALLQYKEAGVGFMPTAVLLFFTQDGLKGLKPFFLHCTYPNEQFQRKTGQCTLKAFKGLEQQDVYFSLLV